MQDYELSVQHVLWRLERLHSKKEVVTKREQGLHRITNGEMVRRVNRLSGALKRLGVKPGDRVAPLAGKIPSIKTIVLMTDGAPAAADHGLGELLDYETLLAAESDDYPWPKLSERMAASMCYTSGTTGNPKGVVYSHRSQFIHTMGVLQADNLAITEKDTVFPIVPMFHANSWGLPYACGMAGS